MKNLRNLLALVAVLLTAIIISGCEDEDAANNKIDRKLADRMLNGNETMTFTGTDLIIYEKKDGNTEWTQNTNSIPDGYSPLTFAIRSGNFITKVFPANPLIMWPAVLNHAWKLYLTQTSQNIDILVTKKIVADFEKSEVTVGRPAVRILELSENRIMAESAETKPESAGMAVKYVYVYTPTEPLLTEGAEHLYFDSEKEAVSYVLDQLHNHFGDTIPMASATSVLPNDYESIKKYLEITYGS